MEDKRKFKRMPLTLTLEIMSLYKQDYEQISDLHEPIEVVNISLAGIGFRSKSKLPIGYYFNANINLGSEDTLHSVIRILWAQPDGDGTYYGCEFVGVSTILSYLFEEYDHKISEADKAE